MHCCDTIHDVLRPRTFPPFLVLGCDKLLPNSLVFASIPQTGRKINKRIFDLSSFKLQPPPTLLPKLLPNSLIFCLYPHPLTIVPSSPSSLPISPKNHDHNLNPIYYSKNLFVPTPYAVYHS